MIKIEEAQKTKIMYIHSFYNKSRGNFPVITASTMYYKGHLHYSKNPLWKKQPEMGKVSYTIVFESQAAKSSKMKITYTDVRLETFYEITYILLNIFVY